MTDVETIAAAIRDVPDFPKPGILFKDITPLLADPVLFKACTELFMARLADERIAKIAAIDARGFLFGSVLADRMNIGLVPIRKKGKLPYKSHEETYDLEYGSATLAVHEDAFSAGERVAVIDDLLATGGTAAASCRLVERAGGHVAVACFLVELGFLNGRQALEGYDTFAPVVF